MSITKSEDVLNAYEVVIILHPDATLEQQKALFQKNLATIQSFGGSFHSLDTWGKRTLANPIKKLKKGVYFHSFFQAKAGAIAELERTMRINDIVLRFAHTRLDNRLSLAKHEEIFKKGLQESAAREREREAKAQARRAAAQAAAQDRHM